MNRRFASLLVLLGFVLGALVPAVLPRTASASSVPPVPGAVEYEFLRREGPEEDFVQLQKLGAEGWQVAATVVVDGTTRRYILMRPRR